MTGYLIDTNALSLLSNSKASPQFIDWLQAQQRKNALYASTITLQEIEKGIVKLERVKGGSLG